MQLSDRDIKQAIKDGELAITAPPGYDLLDVQFQPASIDLRLWDVDDEGGEKWGSGVLLRSGKFALANTVETITLGPGLAARVEGKSSLGRLGLQVHSAGFVDPGFSGEITLELKNLHHEKSIELRHRMFICQLSIHRLWSEAERPYGHKQLGSHYQSQRGITKAWTER